MVFVLWRLLESRLRFGKSVSIRRPWWRGGEERRDTSHQQFLSSSNNSGIANENGGITFFPVQVNVGGQAQAVTSSIQPLSAQALAGSLSSQQVTGTTLQVPGQVAIQQISPGGQPQKQGQPFSNSSVRPRKTSSLSLFFRKVTFHVPLTGAQARGVVANKL